MALNNFSLESIIDKTKQLEKKYEWLQAAEMYSKACDLVIKFNKFKECAIFYQKIGNCYIKAAFQSQSNSQFVKTMKLAIQNYKKAINFFKKNNDTNKLIRADDILARISYAKLWIERDPSKKLILVKEWWTLKSKVLKAYEKIGNQLFVAKTISDILQNSHDYYYFIGQDSKELKEKRNNLISLGEKAIRILSKLNEDYELACVYCWLSLIYIRENTMVMVSKKNDIEKGSIYNRKALEFSKKNRDSWLLGWSYFSLSFLANLQGDSRTQMDFLNLALEQGKKIKNNYLLGIVHHTISTWNFINSMKIDDPDIVREINRNNLRMAKKTINNFKIINMVIWNPYFSITNALYGAASIELNTKKKCSLWKKAVEYGRKCVALIEGLKYYVSPIHAAFNAHSRVLLYYSEFITNLEEKKSVLEELLENTNKTLKFEKLNPSLLFFRAATQKYIASAKYELSKITQNKKIRINLLNDAVKSIEVYRKIIKIVYKKIFPEALMYFFGNSLYSFGEIYYHFYLLTKEDKQLLGALRVYTEAIAIFSRLKYLTGVAEASWQKAKINDQLGKLIDAKQDYKFASEFYLKTATKVTQFKEFFTEYALYMQAWSQIEQARYSHSLENFEDAQQQYEQAAKLHKSTSSWSYLTPNYFAWANLEKAEGFSRQENSKQAKQSFQKALEYFNKAEISFKQKIVGTTLAEKEMIQKLFEASDLRRKYCQVRILMEEAKLLERQGKYLQSSQKYQNAKQKISTIIKKIDVDNERKELEYLKILCEAWKHKAVAEQTNSSEIYLEAAKLFEEAKKHCYTNKASLWAIGNSNFCRGLAAGIKYQTTLSLSDNALAKRHIENAATNYLQAGFKTASEYAKATLRLFDGYILINQAQNELNPEKKAKQYQMAEKLLQMSIDSFNKAKQPEKVSQVKQILQNVGEEKSVALSLNKMMQTPLIVSSTMSFAAPTSTSEFSVGIEKFERANVQVNLISNTKEVRVGESFYLSVEFINAGREPALLMRVEDFIPQDFIVVKKPEIYRVEETILNMKGKQIAPLKLVETKIVLQPTKKGIFKIQPKLHYLDERGQNKTLQLKSVEIKVEEVFLADRVSTGTKDLDSLLLGGIPKEYAVVLSASPSDERELLVKNFLQAGESKNQTTFFVTIEATSLENLLDRQNFHLFLCNPKPKTPIPDQPNIVKLRSKTDLNNLNMAIARESRNLQDKIGIKRICLENISDVLLHSGPEVTRRWLGELTTDLISKGFTILGVLDCSMHPVDQANAVLNLFDGEISLTQSDDPLDCKKSIQVKKLRGQDYIKNPICLTKN